MIHQMVVTLSKWRLMPFVSLLLLWRGPNSRIMFVVLWLALKKHPYSHPPNVLIPDPPHFIPSSTFMNSSRKRLRGIEARQSISSSHIFEPTPSLYDINDCIYHSEGESWDSVELNRKIDGDPRHAWDILRDEQGRPMIYLETSKNFDLNHSNIYIVSTL